MQTSQSHPPTVAVCVRPLFITLPPERAAASAPCWIGRVAAKGA